LNKSLVGEDVVSEETGYRQMQRLLSQNPEMTAVVMLSNVMAVGAVSYLNENQIRMPDRLAVVVIDDYTWSRMTVPPLSVIDQPTHLLGQRASQLLLKRLKEPETPLTVIREPLEFIRRGSF
jgi:LacI family transcriptional regulator